MNGFPAFSKPGWGNGTVCSRYAKELLLVLDNNHGNQDTLKGSAKFFTSAHCVYPSLTRSFRLIHMADRIEHFLPRESWSSLAELSLAGEIAPSYYHSHLAQSLWLNECSFQEIETQLPRALIKSIKLYWVMISNRNKTWFGLLGFFLPLHFFPFGNCLFHL